MCCGPDLTALLEDAFPPGWDRRGQTTPEERLRSRVALRDDACRRRILLQLRHLMDRELCDMQLTDLIAFELGCHLHPAEMGLTATAWLEWVAREVAPPGRSGLS